MLGSVQALDGERERTQQDRDEHEFRSRPAAARRKTNEKNEHDVDLTVHIAGESTVMDWKSEIVPINHFPCSLSLSAGPFGLPLSRGRCSWRY